MEGLLEKLQLRTDTSRLFLYGLKLTGTNTRRVPSGLLGISEMLLEFESNNQVMCIGFVLIKVATLWDRINVFLV